MNTIEAQLPGFLVCLNANGHPLDLTFHKIDRTIPDDRARAVSCYRIIDDIDEDYLFPTRRLAPRRALVTCKPPLNARRKPTPRPDYIGAV